MSTDDFVFVCEVDQPSFLHRLPITFLCVLHRLYDSHERNICAWWWWCAEGEKSFIRENVNFMSTKLARFDTYSECFDCSDNLSKLSSMTASLLPLTRLKEEDDGRLLLASLELLPLWFEELSSPLSISFSMRESRSFEIFSLASWLSSNWKLLAQSFGTNSMHFLWTLYWQSLHCNPCLNKPRRSFLQYWHTVGLVYVWTWNVCGILTREVVPERLPLERLERTAPGTCWKLKFYRNEERDFKSRAVFRWWKILVRICDNNPVFSSREKHIPVGEIRKTKIILKLY